MTLPTMPNAVPTAPAAPTPTNETSAERPNLNDRAAALIEQLETGAEPSIDDAGVPGDLTATTETAPAAPTGESEKERVERQQRIAKMRERERKDYQRRAQTQQQTQVHQTATAEVERLRARLSELEPLNDVFKDEAALLAAAEKKGLDSKKLIDWMRQRLSDPSAVAERQAKTVEEKLAAQIAEQNKKIEQLKAEQDAKERQAVQQQQAHARAMTFIDQTEKSTTSHPLSAALLKRHGPQGLVVFANTFIAPLLGENYELQDLHDHMEQFLDEIQVGASQPTAPSAPSQSTKRNGAAQQPGMTLSNSLTSERATVTEQVPLHRLSLAERERLLREQLERE